MATKETKSAATQQDTDEPESATVLPSATVLDTGDEVSGAQASGAIEDFYADRPIRDNLTVQSTARGLVVRRRAKAE